MTLLTHEYHVVAVARQPNELSFPDLVQLAPIQPVGGRGGGGSAKHGLGWGLELKGDSFVTVATDPYKLPTAFADRLVDLKNNPCELWLFRDGVIVMGGPIIAWQVEGTSLILTARGLLYYTRYMTIWHDRVYENVDISYIVRDSIDRHQDRIWGHFGLFTDTIPTTGKIVSREYFKRDLINVYEEIQELGSQAGGYDLTMDYGTRDVQLWSYLNPDPGYGLDKRDTHFLDFRGIKNPSFAQSLAAGKFGSAVIAIDGEDDDGNLIATTDERINGTLRSSFGMAYVPHRMLAGNVTQAEVDGAADYQLALAGAGVFTPSKDYYALEGISPVDDIVQGDIVTFVFNAGFGDVMVALQIVNLNISVGPGGTEEMNIEFGAEPVSGGPPNE